MPELVRAKFQCTSVRKYSSPLYDYETKKYTPRFLYEYEFLAVTDEGGENKSFFDSTPSGTLKMSAVRDHLFVPGQNYYLDFTPAT